MPSFGVVDILYTIRWRFFAAVRKSCRDVILA